jgi:predicted nucleic acid-binding protein
VRLVVDTNVVVAEMLRDRGRRLIALPVLEFFMSDAAWRETMHEAPRRIDRLQRRGLWTADEAGRWWAIIEEMLRTHVQPLARPLYADREEEARERIPRDPADWPTIAAALTLEAAIWTSDADFLGCGIPVWTTDTLHAYLRRTGEVV